MRSAFVGDVETAKAGDVLCRYCIVVSKLSMRLISCNVAWMLIFSVAHVQTVSQVLSLGFAKYSDPVPGGLTIRICLPLMAPIQCRNFHLSANLVATERHSHSVEEHLTISFLYMRRIVLQVSGTSFEIAGQPLTGWYRCAKSVGSEDERANFLQNLGEWRWVNS